MLHLLAEKLALLKLTFLSADGDLASDDLSIVPHVLRHLNADVLILLERNRASLNGTERKRASLDSTDYSNVADSMPDGKTSLIGHLAKAENGKEKVQRSM